MIENSSWVNDIFNQHIAYRLRLYKNKHIAKEKI